LNHLFDLSIYPANMPSSTISNTPIDTRFDSDATIDDGFDTDASVDIGIDADPGSISVDRPAY